MLFTMPGTFFPAELFKPIFHSRSLEDLCNEASHSVYSPATCVVYNQQNEEHVLVLIVPIEMRNALLHEPAHPKGLSLKDLDSGVRWG